MIWTWPKQIGPVQYDCYSTKIIWLVQINFGPIEGEGISNTIIFTDFWVFLSALSFKDK